MVTLAIMTETTIWSMAFPHERGPCGMKSLRSDTLTMRVTGVRIAVFSSSIVIDVIVHCHTAGVKRQETIVPIIIWLGSDPFKPVQNHIGSGAGNPAIDTFVLDRDVGHHVVE